MGAEGPLAGVRVLDLTRLLPGPYATRVLAELGAEVIKVEDPAGGDYARWYPPLTGDPPASGIFRALNGGKKSVALDLRTEDGRAALEALLPTADVLCDTFRPGVLARLGLAPERLLRDHSGLVYCALTGFGLTGPDRDRPGHDVGYLARAGGLGLGGTEADPMVLGVQVADVGGALAAVAGIIAALFERTRTGRGKVVDVSLTEAALGFAITAFGQRAAGHRARRGRELLDGSRPAYAVYRTKDGRHLAVGALEPKFWRAFVEVLGLEHLEASGLDAGAAGARVRAEVQAALETRTAAEWKHAFDAADACVEVVAGLDDVVEDAHLVARGAVRPGGAVSGPVRVADAERAFAAADASAPPELGEAPALGAHTREVLAAAGVAADRVDRLTAHL